MMAAGLMRAERHVPERVYLAYCSVSSSTPVAEHARRHALSLKTAWQYYALAVLDDGSLLSWGTAGGSREPRAVAGLPRGCTRAAAGYQHALALIHPCPAGTNGSRET